MEQRDMLTEDDRNGVWIDASGDVWAWGDDYWLCWEPGEDAAGVGGKGDVDAKWGPYRKIWDRT